MGVKAAILGGPYWAVRLISRNVGKADFCARPRSPLFARDISTQEIYALDLHLP